MNNGKSIGTVTVGYGSEKERVIEIEDYVISTYTGNRIISVSKTVEDSFVLSVENPESSGRNISSKMHLSRESFFGLLSTAIIYLSHNNVEIGDEINKMQGDSIGYKYDKK